MTLNSVTCSALAAVLALAGCATNRTVPELEAARANVTQAESDPLAREAAGARLKRAQDSLAAAEKSAADGKSADIVREQAYLASRNAQIAQEQVKELKARKEVEQGEADRNRVLLEARTREATVAQGNAERARADAQAQQAQAQAARSDADVARAEAERLKKEMNDLQMKPTERGMILTLGDVLFDTGRAELKPGAQATIDRLAEFLANHAGFKVLIEGHTDSVGSDDYNMGLSQRRAESVAGALAARNLENSRIRVRGMGEAIPVATNDTAAGRQQNRRVEVVFSDDKGAFLPGAERVGS